MERFLKDPVGSPCRPSLACVAAEKPDRVQRLQRTFMTTEHFGHSRRDFLKGTLRGAAAVAAFGSLSLRAQSEPELEQVVRYPDPRIVVLEKRFARYKLGN